MDNYSAVQFISDLQRLCESCSECSECALGGHYCIVYDRPRDIEEIEENIELLRKWAIDNPIEPVKTYKDDFFEKFPNAQKEINGTPKSCTKLAYGEGMKDGTTT